MAKTIKVIMEYTTASNSYELAKALNVSHEVVMGNIRKRMEGTDYTPIKDDINDNRNQDEIDNGITETHPLYTFEPETPNGNQEAYCLITRAGLIDLSYEYSDPDKYLILELIKSCKSEFVIEDVPE